MVLRTFTVNDFGNKLIKDYIELFCSYSIKNEMYARVSLHVLLGQLLRNIYFKNVARKIDIRVHLLLIQPSGTGKGAGYGFFVKLAEDLGLKVEELTEATDAGLVGTIDHFDYHNNRWVITEGLMKDADIIAMEEASTLFDFSSDFSKKNLTYIQIATNPLFDASCKISKKIGNAYIQFKPHCSFLLLSYKPDRLEEAILKRGFIQRFITIFREVDLTERLRILDAAIEGINAIPEEEFKMKYDSLVRRLKVLQRIYGRKETPFEIKEDAKLRLKDVTVELLEMIKEASKKARVKLEEFSFRLYEILTKLAIHHAILCLKDSVDIQDVIYARNLYKPIWRSTIFYVEDLLEPKPVERSKEHRRILTTIDEYKTLLKEGKYVKNEVYVRRKILVDRLKDRWDVSSVTASTRLKELESDGWFERRYFGSIPYVRLLRDVR